jgi:hypothetical protein
MHGPSWPVQHPLSSGLGSQSSKQVELPSPKKRLKRALKSTIAHEIARRHGGHRVPRGVGAVEDARDKGRFLRAFDVEPMTEHLAKRAGEAIAAGRGATVVDAIAMASAAQRDDVVYTSDFDDLSRLRDRHFRGVRLMGV